HERSNPELAQNKDLLDCFAHARNDAVPAVDAPTDGVGGGFLGDLVDLVDLVDRVDESAHFTG
ncbi:MAG: hypothetical protein LBR29_05395, partial [Methylobacteriaceae bacterium]|nr:hypothetical protein [Methylobacteriaceae bacterium]